ncbi:MAG: FAD-dependent oxidoreductase [Acidimicrobiia bacterium]|nr:FAD-dependent oxidoreductase [Acidimicrobiia bacterium]
MVAARAGGCAGRICGGTGFGLVRPGLGVTGLSGSSQPGLHRRHGRHISPVASADYQPTHPPAHRTGQPSGLGERAGSGTKRVRPGSVSDRATRVVVVGGGLAGLSAGLEALDQGAAVTLLERRPRLGGATWSFRRKGIWFDNGQHVFLRCCTAYLRFLKRIGSSDQVYLQPRLDIPVLSPDGRAGSIRRTPGPAPLHLAPSLLTYPHLNLYQRLKVLRAGWALQRLDPTDPELDETRFGDWLSEHGQGRRAVETFWNLVVLPTVNVTAEEASLKLAAKVFVTGLLTEAPAADVGWATVPLSVLHGDAARRALEADGARVSTGVRVTAVQPDIEGGFQVRLEDETIGADAVVIAVPHDAVGSLLPSGSVEGQDRLEELGVSPIVNVHLVYDRPVTNLRMFATVGSDAQYVFDRTEGADIRDGRQCLSVSLSAAERFIGWSPVDLISHFTAELERLLPAATQARITDSIVTREPSATFNGVPGTHHLRAGTRCAVPGVYLAGAWCDTGWPATMEGAVRSGTEAGRQAALVGYR